MSNLSITAKWHDDINQVERNELITGGAGGNANIATKQLGDNSLYLKKQVENLQQEIRQEKKKIKELEDNFKELSNSEDGSTLNKGVNGFCKLPNGFILQWGTVSFKKFVPEQAYTLKFHHKFPSACVNLLATRQMSSQYSAEADGGILVRTFSKDKAELSLQAFSGSNSSLRGFTWFAIGY